MAANARAALAAGSGAAPRAWAGIRLVTPDGAAWPRRWLTVTLPGRPPIWVMTDLDGRARVHGRAAGAAPVVTVPDAQ